MSALPESGHAFTPPRAGVRGGRSGSAAPRAESAPLAEWGSRIKLHSKNSQLFMSALGQKRT